MVAEMTENLIKVYRNPLRYDLPSPVSPPRYEHWASERNNWTVEGSPRRFRTSEVQSRSGGRDECTFNRPIKVSSSLQKICQNQQ